MAGASAGRGLPLSSWGSAELMRYAFLTTEFPTTLSGAGGLSNYIRRMAQLLVGAGYTVEVFVLDSRRGDVVEQEGYAVRHVRHSSSKLSQQRQRVLHKVGAHAAAERGALIDAARAIAAALEAQHALAPFDIVQSADYRGIGLAIQPLPGRIRLVRCSSAIDLYMKADGRSDPGAIAQIAIEHAAVANADVAIAPSELVARHYSALLNRKVHVVRPPAFLEESPSPRPHWLPARYLVHFAGWLGSRKGTALIADALPRVLEVAPDFVMFWFGHLPAEMRKLQVAPNNLMIGSPLDKATLYAVLRGAAASVLPSTVDNIPNTAMESLLLGTPTILTRGASLDEMVQEGRGVLFVEPGDSNGLAKAMIEAWQGRIGIAAQPWIESSVGRSFSPDTSLASHLELLRSCVRRVQLT